MRGFGKTKGETSIMKKLFTFLLVAIAMTTFFTQSSKGQTTYEIIYWDNHTHASNVPYCACDSIKCVPPAGATGVTWFAAGAPETYHGDTLVLASGFNGQVDCFFTGGVKNLRLCPLTTPILPSFAPTYMVCGVETITLDAENYSQYAFNSYLWSNGATTKTITVGAGTYSVTISNVCGSIIHSTTITEFNPNAPDLGPDLTVCHGSTVVLDPGTGFSHYSWLPAITNDTILYANADGMYIVQTTNAVGGCVDRDTIIVTFLQPTPHTICYVEFDTLSFKNRIVWSTPPANAASINIYDEISAGVYSLIGAVPNTQTSFIHMGSSPQNMSNSYKIAVIDTCGNESSKSAFHKTITLLSTYDQLADTYGFTWSAYQGLSVATYYLYGLTATNQAIQIGSVPGNSYFYNYTNPSSLFVKYFVAFLTPTCSNKTDYLVKSNLVQSVIAGIEENVQAELKIYPNPAKEKIYIETNETEFSVEIINMYGQVVIQERNKKEIDIRVLSSGTYMVQLTGKTYNIQKTIIVY